VPLRHPLLGPTQLLTLLPLSNSLFCVKYLLLAASLALASCATQRTLMPARSPADATSGGRDEGPAYTPATLTQRPDSVIVQHSPSFIDKVLGRTPEPFKVAVTPARIGKKSTVNIYYGPATVITTRVGKKATAATAEGVKATTVGKVKAPTAIGDSATATDNTKAGQRGGAAATAPGAIATATTEKTGWPW
jgi:hypothetical protein